MVPPEPPAGADEELAADELPAAALELGDDDDATAADDELTAALDDELTAALDDVPPAAVLDDEQAAREPATAIATHVVITRRVLEERATLILPGVECLSASRNTKSAGGIR